jgi:hypothetical protein
VGLGVGLVVVGPRVGLGRVGGCESQGRVGLVVVGPGVGLGRNDIESP